MNDPKVEELIIRAELMLTHSPIAAVAILEHIVEDTSNTPEQRAEAFALLAQYQATERSSHGLSEARTYLARAEALHPNSKITYGRILLTRGYIAFRESQDNIALNLLNESIEALKESPRIQARAFDVIGMLASRSGDLDHAYRSFEQAINIKKQDLSNTDPHSLALTLGNLGRLELSRRRYVEAEYWLRQDLSLILIHEPKPTTEAHVRNQLAQALHGQCPGRETEVQAELIRAQHLAPRNSITALYILKNTILFALHEEKIEDAKKSFDELTKANSQRHFPEIEPWIALLEGRILRTKNTRKSSIKASTHFETAYKLFLERNMPLEACDAVLDYAASLMSHGEQRKAIAVLSDAHNTIKAPPPLKKTIDEFLYTHSKNQEKGGFLPGIQAQFRHLLKSTLPPPKKMEESTTKEEPSLATICVLELRGMDEFWSQNKATETLLHRISRILQALAIAADSVGAIVDRPGPDRLILHFPGNATSRAQSAIRRANARLIELHAEQPEESSLQIAAAISIGWVKRYEIQGIGPSERVHLGPAVTRACRLASQAHSGETLVDTIPNSKISTTKHLLLMNLKCTCNCCNTSTNRRAKLMFTHRSLDTMNYLFLNIPRGFHINIESKSTSSNRYFYKKLT